MKIICDIETDSLDPKQVWCIVTKEVDTGVVRQFWRPDIDSREFLEYTSKVTQWIGHYFIKFDYWKVLRVFFPQLKIKPLDILDTHVCSKLFRYDLKGGHGLEAWGERLGVKKPEIANFATVNKEEILHRCTQDVEINFLLYKKMERALASGTYDKAIELEHKMEFICLDMELNGFPFDIEGAIKIRSEIEDRLSEIDAQIQSDFKPTVLQLKEVTPKLTKKGTLSLVDFKWLGPNPDLSPFSAESPFSVIAFEPFNPSSVPQIIERLNEAGWKPTEKTKGHIEAEREYRRNRKDEDLRERLERFKKVGWSISETNLATLPKDAPEGARKLAERILLMSRRSVLTEWINAYRDSTKAVHGRFNGIGSWTHRMSHQAPNQANIPSDPDVKDRNNPTPVEQLQLQYGVNLRKLWQAGELCRLIGVDADGIQLRILAHYMDDKDFIDALVSGDKALGTDVHTLNAVKLGIGPQRRDAAKTFIYAFLLGAGVDKIANILHTNNKGASNALESFLEATPGLKRLKSTQIPRDADRGYFVGLDGRLVPVPSEHHVLAGYLQNGESTLMKLACTLWRADLKSKGIWFQQVDFVHDEWQTRIRDNDEEAAAVIKAQTEAITQAGVLLNMSCPLIGQGKQGYNWRETH